MPFDANLTLVDGSADWTYANIVSSDYGTPVSTTRNAGGFAVIDLLQAGASPGVGLTVVLILSEEAAAADDALTAIVQQCASAAFGSAVSNLADFDLAAVTSGVIVGSETPCTVMRRVAPTMRYIRLEASCASGDDFKAGYCFIIPWGYSRL